MADKEFKKSYMHPTRRKLADMVLTGEYDKDIQVGYREKKENKKREVGETWEDENYIYEQKEGYITKSGKNSKVFTEVRKYLQSLSTCKSKECGKKKYGRTDKKLISKTGFCSTCLAKKEWEIKKDGLWEEYSKYKIYSNMASYGTEVLEKLNDALGSVKDHYEFVNEDGSIEKWQSPKPAEQLKQDLLDDIEKGKKELAEVIEKRNEMYDLLKDKNYELVEEIRY